MAKHSHEKEHEVLYLHCVKCGGSAITVIIMDGILIFDCVLCEEPLGAMENIQLETRALLQQGCNSHI